MQSGVSNILSYFVRDYGVHPRHSPWTFPLGLLAPRCLGLARFLALPLCGAGARAPAVWGGEGILPPASVSSSPWFAKVFSALFQLVVCVRLCFRCSCLRSPPSHNPLPRFQNSFCSVASASDFCIARERRRSSKGVDALAEMSEARSRMCLPHPPCAHEGDSLVLNCTNSFCDVLRLLSVRE